MNACNWSPKLATCFFFKIYFGKQNNRASATQQAPQASGTNSCSTASAKRQKHLVCTQKAISGLLIIFVFQNRHRRGCREWLGTPDQISVHNSFEVWSNVICNINCLAQGCTSLITQMRGGGKVSVLSLSAMAELQRAL